ncbi:carbohydrate ABC transporter substrate-binding protein, CUT1 family [Austwickia chelonae]|uniref:Putative sugar ABC transporter substrate-binding protein n=1 Tax=Austwickia chelonae NBRC 105200 TaxID=1184607 RepID=K6VR98_9MICO|nr:sugar ABC transporter substrate-binding protein [Austwickia chelonae]GAB79279.1 putative sugar ABC transporter substrate-binding protein [Austwickia chelonae NBRC 105200]SEW37874.1 carbohydrate ABC transporter substrate-binding protein, CUT1 family [Austwickia chelonae]
MGKPLACILTGLLLLPLAACGDSGSSNSSARGDGQKLTVWIMEGTNPDSTAYFTQVKEAFKAKTGAELDVQLVPWASAKDKFTTAIAGGTTPDVAEVGTTWTPEFADVGALADLTARVRDAGLADDLVDGLRDAGTLEGKLYGMPWYAGVRAVLYDKEVFARSGITSPPATWAEFAEAVTKVKSHQPGIVPFAVPGSSEFTAVPFIWGAGGELAVKEGDRWRSRINSPESVAGITFLTDLAVKQQASTPAAATWNEKDVLAAYAKGGVAMIVSGSWTPPTLTKDAPEVAARTGAFPIPGKDGMARSFTGGSHLAVFEKSTKKDLAFELVRLMTTGDLATRWGKESTYFPGTKSLVGKLGDQEKLTKVFVEQFTRGGKTVPVTPAWGKVQGKKVVPTMMQSILSGKATVQQAADQAAKDMDEVFAAK